MEITVKSKGDVDVYITLGQATFHVEYQACASPQKVAELKTKQWKDVATGRTYIVPEGFYPDDFLYVDSPKNPGEWPDDEDGLPF